jgi:hypothetical protein
MRPSRRIIFACNAILLLLAILLVTGGFVRLMMILDVLPTPSCRLAKR